MGVKEGFGLAVGFILGSLGMKVGFADGLLGIIVGEHEENIEGLRLGFAVG